jgi:hypothetical protein
MARFDIFDQNRAQESEVRHPREGRQEEPNGEATSIGRAAQNDAPAGPNRPVEIDRSTPVRRAPERRSSHQDRDRAYPLRASEIRAMADIGRFRTIDAQDLTQFAYGGDAKRMEQEVENLRDQGLVEEKTAFRAHKEPRKILTLTERGERVTRKASGLPREQRMYHGFVKAREINHDADLYRVYQNAAEEIRSKGGKPLKVRLDFEMKAAIQREKQTAKGLPQDQKEKRLQAVAERHGLTLSHTTIHVPDIQIEYETQDREIAHANLELVSENYRSEGIREKANSGFQIYARGGDTNRVRRALSDTHTVERVLSL